ncbi:MAG: AarF/ABC1/UbiB kinase family protein [Rhodospirillales bacterium]|nr:AarF/ABC1/UbiB kinase family protein [Rhodospirillales bacterium]
MDEQNSFGGRFARYARVSTAVGGLAARMAGERYLGIKVDRDAHARELRAALGGLKGPLMKVAQLLATIPEAIPDEYVAELSQLQSNAPSMGWSFVRRRMQAELGHGWEAEFRNFEHEAAAAASLGQVHRATGLNGHKLACKLQYPDMASAVEADLGQLRLILGIFERYDRAVSTKKVHEEISERLREELDYEREGQNMALYADILRSEPGVHVPIRVPELSTKRLLTMSWLDGERITDAADRDRGIADQVAINMFRAWYVPLYRYGVLHGDPHLGNYSARPDGSINLMDFGCVRVFKPSFIKAVIDLYRAVQTNDDALAADAYRVWGFGELSEEVVGILNIWARFIYEPLLDDRLRLIGQATNGIYGREIAHHVHKELVRVGGVEVPREFVFMDRATLGLGSVFIHLKTELNWHRIFEDLIADFDIDAMTKRQAKVLKRNGISVA